MKRYILTVVALVGLVVALGLAWFIWPRHVKGSLLRLKIVRRTIEQGKPVVFFRIEVADRRDICIVWVEKLMGTNSEGMSLHLGSKQDFWAPSQLWPNLIGHPEMARKEFGVLAPTNAAWKLRVSVFMQQASMLDRLKSMPGLWRSQRQNGS